VARDRQRAKQRKARRAEHGLGPAPRQPLHEEVPESLEHASGEVEEVDAALIAGAGGVPADDVDADVQDDADEGPDLAGRHPEELSDEGLDLAGRHPEELSDEDFDEVEDEVDEVAAGEPVDAGAGRPATRPRAAAEPKRRGNRLIGFLRASWAELQRVQWPDRRQVGQATAVVLGFVIVAGAYLGLADQVAKQIVDFII
jgi:preprotein translocase SecE subunit